MKSVIFSVAALVAAVSAQTTTTAASSSSTCGAQPVLEQCLITTQGYIDLCQSTDYNCLCAKYNDLLTCFNNCPNDSRQSSYASSRDVNCNNASVYSSSTTVPATRSSTSAAATATTTGTSTRTSATGTGTATSSSASGSSTANAAAEVLSGASGMFAALAGAVVALL